MCYYAPFLHLLKKPFYILGRKDISFKFVSCPTSNTVYIRTYDWYGDEAVFLVPLNYRNVISTMELRGHGDGDQKWVRRTVSLNTRDKTN